MIGGMKRHFLPKWNIALLQLHLQSFLIAILIQPGTQFFMNLMQSSYNIIYMFLILLNIYHINMVFIVSVVFNTILCN